MKKLFSFLFVAALLMPTIDAVAQQKYGAKPLEFESLKEWKKVHRPAIMDFFLTDVYGHYPQKQVTPRFELLEQSDKALGGKAIRKQVAIHLDGMPTPILLLIYQPAGVKGKVPAFVGMNFKGNHQVNIDPEIIISDNAPKGKDLGTDAPRGAASSRWPLEEIVGAGYAVATIYRGDVDPDHDDGFKNGIHPLFYRAGQTKPDAEEWGTIGAWAWGLSRVMDYLEQDKSIDHKRVAVIGHSRLGKTALWAGATDERFAIAISNDSGCGGAALSARKVGETVAKINKSFPHWFCDNYNKYNDKEEALLVDQQGLIALIAPRPVYVASATEDEWADPEGEFLSALYASPVYELYGKKGLAVSSMPKPEQPSIEGYVGYHIRTGKHDITLYDWQQYIKFANQHFGR
ncbi:MAG: acetylxylan esterase [Alistipes sp.]|nr:acetylxylan esterase [Alistipes sp.]